MKRKSPPSQRGGGRRVSRDNHARAPADFTDILSGPAARRTGAEGTPAADAEGRMPAKAAPVTVQTLHASRAVADVTRPCPNAGTFNKGLTGPGFRARRAGITGKLYGVVAVNVHHVECGGRIPIQV